VQHPVFFDRNENRYGPAPACLNALQCADRELLFNYTRAYQQGSYSELSARLAADHGLDEKQLILGYGCEDILKEAVQHFVPAGGTILIPSASWWYYRAMADEVGGRSVEYPLRPTPLRYEYDVNTMLQLRQSANPAMILVASPNNPTGNVLSRDDLRRLLDAYRGVPFVLDQAYFGFKQGEIDDYSALLGEYEDLMILRTFSKLYALAGVRIGYAMTGRGLVSFQKYCARYLGYNRLSERVALAALDSPAYYSDLAARMAGCREKFYQLFRHSPGCEIYESEANFVLVKMPVAVAERLERELVEQKLIVKFFREPEFIAHARISLGDEADNERLIAAIRAVMGSPRLSAEALGETA
jgi:histidinol-phosphate aminotransferase